MMSRKKWKLSASLISSFKACAMRCYYKYVIGVRPIETTDSLRVGTNWHRLLEIAGMKPGSVCPECAKLDAKNSDCPLCHGTDFLPEDILDAVVTYLGVQYVTTPLYKTQEEWDIEYNTLLYGLSGYVWRYADCPYDIIAEELTFSIPLKSPISGRSLPNVETNGKIDKLIRMKDTGFVYVMEHKTTSSSVDEDSTFWSHLNLDTQTTLYIYAARYLQKTGQLEGYGIKPDDPLISGVLYDAFHKPTIKPKKLTQAESKEFVESGEYMGQQFNVTRSLDNEILEVDGTPAITTPGKKEGTFAIRETPDMYGNRLLHDISERPEFYFNRKEVNKTEKDMIAFEQELMNIYHTLKFLDKSDNWWKNEQQCEATFKCPYIGICYNNVEVDAVNPPEGFKCIFKEKKDDRKKITK